MDFMALFSTRFAAEVAVQVLGKSTLLLALAAVATLLLRRGTPGQRHAVWSAAFGLALVLPFLAGTLPVRAVPLLTYPAEVLDFTAEPAGSLAEAEGPAAATARGMPSEATEWAPGATVPGGISVPGVEAAPGDGGDPVPTTDAIGETGETRTTGEARTTAGTEAAAGPGAVGPAAPDDGFPLDPGLLALAFLLVWATGAVALTVRLVGHWVRIGRLVAAGRVAGPDEPVTALLRREARVLGLRRAVRVVWSDRLGVPATGGILRPVLILPTDAASWPEGRLRAVLLHELAHVRRWDLLSHQVAELVRIVYWVNPLVWVAHRAAAGERERACDREVVRTGIPGTEYAGVLVEMARRCGPTAPAISGTLTMARPGEVLRRRVDAVLDGSSGRTVGRGAALAAFLVLTLGALPLASVEVIAAPGAKQATGAAPTGSLEDRLRAVRNFAGQCIGAPTRSLAAALLEDPDPRVRAAAARGLGRHAQPGSVRALERAAGDRWNDHAVRVAATQALGSVGGAGAVAALTELLADDDAAVRWMALTGLERTVRTPSETLRARLVEVLEHDPVARIRARAVGTLHALGCEDALPALRTAATADPSPDVRARATELLAGHGETVEKGRADTAGPVDTGDAAVGG